MMFRKSLIYILVLMFPAIAYAGKRYDSYKGLVMAGYQGWFNAPSDGAGRGWYHYTGRNGFCPGSCTIDLWPDMREYQVSYASPFSMSDGSQAHLFSSYDESTVDLHFDWMQRYGLDGVFMQRFVSEIRNEDGLKHFNKVLDSAMKSANRYERAIAVMYDLSGMAPGEEDILLADIDRVAKRHDLFDHDKNPSYLYHNGKPLVTVWGLGFNDHRRYGLKEGWKIVRGLKEKGFSVMIGVPTQWQQLKGDTESDKGLHDLIRECDIVMPWFVGRYNEATYKNYSALIKGNIEWAKNNGVDYAPLCYPGFSWKNMHPLGMQTFQVPRNKGSFFWKQLRNVIASGAEMIYIAMFDEIDEGTAIFKCAHRVPVAAPGSTFVPMDEGVDSDYYMWLSGQAGKMLRKEMPLSDVQPRKNSFPAPRKGTLDEDVRRKFAAYNVTFNSLDTVGSKASMPLGNGDITANVWVEKSGDLMMYIGKSDAWSEATRLLKVGRLRISMTPNPFESVSDFSQTLDLGCSTVNVTARAKGVNVRLSVWVDANNPVIHVSGTADAPVRLECRTELMRPTELVLNGESGVEGSCLGVSGSPIPVVESADIVSSHKSRLEWRHHNRSSFFSEIISRQGAENMAGRMADPYLDRIFGASVWGKSMKSVSDTVLVSEKPLRAFSLSIGVLTQSNSTPERWSAAMESVIADEMKNKAAYEEHCRWWDDFWGRSWVFLSGDEEAEAVTRGYLLQRFMMACQSRGAYPAKFNGGLFTFDYDGHNGDFRRWGPAYWFQNNRHLYWPLIATGDYDLLKPWMKFYMDVLPMQKEATRNQHGHDGAYFPETINMFGLFHQDDWGWDNEGNVSNTRWIRYHFSGALELIAQMLDLYKATGDDEFAAEYLVPFSKETIRFFSSHWRKADGRFSFYPANSAEMYWDCTNPMDYIAGLHYTIGRLSGLECVPANLREEWAECRRSLPPLPMDMEKGILLPAEKYGVTRNFENPELYAVFPFRIFGLGRENLDVALATFEKRLYPESTCWHQDPIQAPLLGLKEVTRKSLVENARSLDPEVAFPGFWAPRHDYMPDFDNGGALMSGVQYMLLQDVDDSTLVIPSLPDGWDADFKLHSLAKGAVRAQTSGGKLVKLEMSGDKMRKVLVDGKVYDL